MIANRYLFEMNHDRGKEYGRCWRVA